MKSKPTFTYIVRSIPDARGDGGQRRVSQIIEHLSQSGPINLITQRDKSIDYSSIQLIPEDQSYESLWQPSWWKWVEQRLKEAEQLCQPGFESTISGTTVVIEDPLFFAPLIRRLKANGIDFFVVLHNLESLITEHVRENMAFTVLQEELALLEQAKGVICIANEEQWLLNRFGIPALYLPYYPADTIEQELLALREQRLHSYKNHILVTGTMGNTPTRVGTLKLLRLLQEAHPEVLSKLTIVSFDIDRYHDLFAPFEVRIRADLNQADYNDVLTSAIACLCYQESGGGALCKIPEMLVAGIPVLANTTAARSYHNLDGLYEYATTTNLVNAIVNSVEQNGSNLAIPAIPNIKNSGRLIHWMQSITG